MPRPTFRCLVWLPRQSPCLLSLMTNLDPLQSGGARALHLRPLLRVSAPTSRVLRVWTRRLLQLSTSTLCRPSTLIVHNNKNAASNNSLHCTIKQVKWVVVTMLKMKESRQYHFVFLSSRTTLQQTAILVGLTPSQLLQQHQNAWAHATAPTCNHTHLSLIATLESYCNT